MALDFVKKKWEGVIPGIWDLTVLMEIKAKTVGLPYNKPKTIHQPELTQKADLALKDLLHSGGVLDEAEIAKFAQKFASPPGGASFPVIGSKTKIVGKGPNIQQIPKKSGEPTIGDVAKGVIFDSPSGKEVFMGIDVAKEGSDKTAYVTINKTVTDIVGEPVAYDPNAPLEINWDALDPTTKKMVQEKEQEIMEKIADGDVIEKFDLQIGQPMVNTKKGFMPGKKPVTTELPLSFQKTPLAPDEIKLHTKELIAETHLPYQDLDIIGMPWENFPGGHAAWSKNNDALLAKVEETFGLTPVQQGKPKGVPVVNIEVEEDDHVGLAKAGLELLIKAGIMIKSCDIHKGPKNEIDSGTIEVDLHDFGSSSALCMALDLLKNKKPKIK